MGGRIPFQVAVHDGEEDLQKQVDGVYQHRKEEKPRLSRHDGGIFLLNALCGVFGGGRSLTCLSSRTVAIDSLVWAWVAGFSGPTEARSCDFEVGGRGCWVLGG